MNGNSQGVTEKATKVLLVDDNHLTRSILRTILRDDGYHQIREAKDADSGLKMALHFEPALIFLDIQMPGKSGLDLLVDLKLCVPQARVLMVTASNDRQSVEASLRGQADGYLIKPFSAGVLLKTLEGVLLKQAKGDAPQAPSV